MDFELCINLSRSRSAESSGRILDQNLFLAILMARGKPCLDGKRVKCLVESNNNKE